MRRLIFIFFIILFFSSSSHSTEIGDPRSPAPVTGSLNPLRYSEGYVMGTIASLGSKGVIIYTLEGEIKLGHASAKGGFIDEGCVPDRIHVLLNSARFASFEQVWSQARIDCTVEINPWPFSSYAKEDLYPIRENKTPFVAIHFRSYFWLPLLKSENYLVRVYPVDSDILRDGEYYESKKMPVARTLRYEEGFLDGRIVKASLDGVIRKANEIVVQHGTGGNVFSILSVSDKAMFEFIIKTMLAGKMVRIHFVQLFRPMAKPINLIRGYDTNYRVFRVDVIPESSNDTPSKNIP
jgi:hypothetical protein